MPPKHVLLKMSCWCGLVGPGTKPGQEAVRHLPLHHAIKRAPAADCLLGRGVCVLPPAVHPPTPTHLLQVGRHFHILRRQAEGAGHHAPGRGAVSRRQAAHQCGFIRHRPAAGHAADGMGGIQLAPERLVAALGALEWVEWSCCISRGCGSLCGARA